MTTKPKTPPMPPPVDAGPEIQTAPPVPVTVPVSSLLAEAGSLEPVRVPEPLTTGQKLERSGWDIVEGVERPMGKFDPSAYALRCLRCVARQHVPAGPGGAMPDEFPPHVCRAAGPRPPAAGSAPAVPAPVSRADADERSRTEGALRSGTAALARLEQRANAPQDEQARLGAELRQSLEPYRARALACALRLEPHRAAAESVLKRLTALEVSGKLREWELQLGGDSTLVRQLRDAANHLRPSYQEVLAGDRSVPSVGARLARIGPWIDRLTARDVHVGCPAATPAGCGVCQPAKIKTQVADCEGQVALIPQALRTMSEKFERIDHVLTTRGVVPITAWVRDQPTPDEVTLSHDAASALAPLPTEEA